MRKVFPVVGCHHLCLHFLGKDDPRWYLEPIFLTFCLLNAGFTLRLLPPFNLPAQRFPPLLPVSYVIGRSRLQCDWTRFSEGSRFVPPRDSFEGHIDFGDMSFWQSQSPFEHSSPFGPRDLISLRASVLLASSCSIWGAF